VGGHLTVTPTIPAVGDSGGEGTADASPVVPIVPKTGANGAEPASAPPGGLLMWALQIQRVVWKTLDDPSSSSVAKYLSTFIMLVIALSVVSFTVESIAPCRYVNVYDTVEQGNETITYRSESPSRICELAEGRYPFPEIEYFCIMCFSVEYLLRLFTCCAGPGLFRFIFDVMNTVDLLAIAPWYIQLSFTDADGLKGLAVLRVLRLTRVMRVFKMSKNFKGLMLLVETLRKSVAALVMLIFFVVIIMILFSTLVYETEKGDYDVYRKQYVTWRGGQTGFESIPSSMWWCIVTMTTVGYGDVSPDTWVGQVIGIATMFCGLIVLSLPITIIGANFDELYRDSRKQELEKKKKLKQEALEKQRLAQQAEAAAASPDGKGLQMTPKNARPSVNIEDEEEPGPGSSMPHIQELIDKSQRKLQDEIEKLLARAESDLRCQIHDILCEHAVDMDASRPSLILPEGATAGLLRPVD